MKKKIILYLYNSLNDPLIQGNIMLYILESAKTGEFQFHIVTYEQDQFRLTDKEKIDKKKEFESLNIHWRALEWSSGSAIKKGFDFLRAASFIFYLRFFKGYTSIISLATVAGVFAYMYSIIFGLKLYLYQYEPHSEYVVLRITSYNVCYTKLSSATSALKRIILTLFTPKAQG